MAASSLAGLDNSSPMHNVHLDVLSASPETEESRVALVEELKRRARGSIGCKNYVEAEVLYSKAIEVMMIATTSSTAADAPSSSSSELAILHTNRSLCRYHMGKFEASVHDARQATLLDKAYVKAHWRLGQGLNQQQLHHEALAAFQQALQLEPNNKALQKELHSTEQQLQRLQQPNTSTATTAAATNSTTSNSKSKSRKESHTVKADDEEDDDVLFPQSDSMRGYKVVDGKKTSYFHREISEEERRLIGDIAPKKLNDDTVVAANLANNCGTATVVEGTSVWNTAGTWEEKDVTQWATDTLRAALLATHYTLPKSVTTAAITSTSIPLCASVSKVKNFSGHASVATVRGKRRYIYEFAITLEWKLPLQDSTTTGKMCSGTLTFPDVDGSCDGVYDTSDYTVNSDTPPEARHLLDRYIKSEGLRDEITKTLNNWIKLFEDTYSI